MKRAHLACVTSALLVSPLLGGCNTDPLVVVENDGGDKGNTNDSGIKGNDDDSGIKGNDDSGINGNDDAAIKNGGDGGPGPCASSGVTFDLTVGATGNVWFGGSTPPWPPASFGCPSWLTITPPAGSSVGNPQGGSVNLVKNGCAVLCPAAQPEPAADQSFTWDGTYYPVTGSDPITDCDTPACAPPGVYVATLCVGYDGADAGVSQGAPTCDSFSFTWPPASHGEATVQATITPTPGGG
jgi:hypothetical protein